jgi:hypothetical protein
VSGLDIHLNSPTSEALACTTCTLQPATVLSDSVMRSCFRNGGQYAEHDAISHLVTSIEKCLCVAPPPAAPRAQLLKATQRFGYTLAAQPIQRPEEQQVKLALRCCQHHCIELRTVLLASTRHSVNEVQNENPAMLSAYKLS